MKKYAPPSFFMQLALEQAQQAATIGEVPIGAVLTDATGLVLAAAHNLVETHKNPLFHAEMLVLQAALTKHSDKWLEGCTLYVTLEPCAMCAQAISLSRLQRLYFGAYDSKGGGVEHGARVFQQPTCHFRPEIYGGIMEQQCAALLQHFFQQKRG